MTYEKRITPNSKGRRHLWFDDDDIDLLAKRLSKRFSHVFTRGFPLRFQYGADYLEFSPTRPLTPKAAQKHLRGLGVAPRLIDMAVNAIKGYVTEGFPKPDRIRFDLWFQVLGRSFFAGNEIKETLAANPENLEKWEQRLKTCGRTWGNVALSDGAIVRITRTLFETVLRHEITDDALRKHHWRWKRGRRKSLFHGRSKKGGYDVSLYGRQGDEVPWGYDVPAQALMDLD